MKSFHFSDTMSAITWIFLQIELKVNQNLIKIDFKRDYICLVISCFVKYLK